MSSAAQEKYRIQIEESIARLLSRANDSRRLQIADLRGRVEKSIEKYVLRADENASVQEIKEFVDAIAADDLCLVIACEKGDEKAWEDLVKNFDATVKSAARRISNNAEDAEDLAGSIWAELYGLKHDKDGKLKTKLAYYSGRGSLKGWLRAVVSQLAIDGFRKDAKFVQIEESREFENLANDSAENADNAKVVHANANPEENFSRTQTGNDVSNALKKAISRLESEDRLILKLYYFDDLNLKNIGATLGFHEATASRKIARLQTEIRKSVEKILIGERGWTKDEVARHLSDAALKLDVGLERMFALLLCAALVQEFWNSGVQ
ncbi:MAG: sigma-70 family RNA polymerase sigma factor [Acidobacteria bacterium]|nr:sigma-70 family RNA polymerase sigma factor [Acidobacteriota bacterium]